MHARCHWVTIAISFVACFGAAYAHAQTVSSSTPPTERERLIAEFKGRLKRSDVPRIELSTDKQWIYIMPVGTNPTGKLEVYSAETFALTRTVEIDPRAVSTDATYDFGVSPSGRFYVAQSGPMGSRLLEIERPESKAEFRVTPLEKGFPGYSQLTMLAPTRDGKIRMLAKDLRGQTRYITGTLDETKKPPVFDVDEDVSMAELVKRLKDLEQRFVENCRDCDPTELSRRLATADLPPATHDPNPAICPTPDASPASGFDPSFWQASGQMLGIALGANAGLGGSHYDVKASVQLGPLRDYFARKDWIKSKDHSFLTFLLDSLAPITAYDLGFGAIQYGLYSAMGMDTQWLLVTRLYNEVTQGQPMILGKTGWEDDGNFGSLVNLFHGIPHWMTATYMRMRGYSEELAFLGAMIGNVIGHEGLYECWEKPKSGHDYLMNTLGAFAGAFGLVDWRIEMSVLTGKPISKYSFETSDGKRIWFGFEHNPDPAHRSQMPWTLLVGTEFTVTRGMQMGANVGIDPDHSMVNLGKQFTHGPLKRMRAGLDVYITPTVLFGSGGR